MKLKKLVSLALAGVLAVSMLAGCKANGSSSSSEQPASGVNAASVIAALDKSLTDKATFSASASLQTTADKAASYANGGIVTFDMNLLKKVDTKLVSNKLPEVKTGTDSLATDKVTQSYTFIVDSSNFLGASDKATADYLAKEIAKQEVEATSNKKISALANAGAVQGDASDHYKYEFKYTADVAVTSAANANGQVTYYAVVTLTRTPNRVSV